MRRGMGVAGPLHRGVEIGRVVIIGKWRVEIGPAAEPALRRCKKTCVHMHGRDMRIGHMRHQADAGREKARVVSSSVDGGGEFRRESDRAGGDVDSHLFEDAALHQPLPAAPARTSVRTAPLPWRAGEPAWTLGRPILPPLEPRPTTTYKRL